MAFEVAANDADVNGYEPVWIDGEVRGFCTSGGYSHHAGKSVALALVPADVAQAGWRPRSRSWARDAAPPLITEPLFDADGARMRG